MDPGEVLIRELIEKVIFPGVPHCRLCYRSAHETKIVRPVHLLEFSKLTKRKIFDSPIIEAACVMCEAAARIAVRTHKALAIGESLKSIMTFMLRQKKLDQYSNQFPKSIEKLLPANGRALSIYREKTKLRQTEVLLVDSNMMYTAVSHPQTSQLVDSMENAANVRPEQADPSIETVVLDDEDDIITLTFNEPDASNQIDIHEHSMNQRHVTQPVVNNGYIELTPHLLQTPEKYVTNEQVVTPAMQPNALEPVKKLPILINFKQFIEQAHSLRKDYAAIVPNKMQLISGHESIPDNFLLHPIVSNGGGVFTVPSLGAEIKNGTLVYNKQYYVPLPVVKDADNMSKYDDVINTIRTNLPQNKDVLIPAAKKTNGLKRGRPIGLSVRKKPERYKKDEDTRIPTEDTESEDVTSDIIVIDNILKNALEAKKKKAEEATVLKATNNAYLLDIDKVDSIIADRCDGDKSIGIIADVRSQAPTTLTKTQSSKIDWEDKIPMDVISFMDATDPNAVSMDEMILPDARPRDAVFADIHHEDHVIDLC